MSQIPFLEERLSVEVKYGAFYGDEYAVKEIETANGQVYPQLLHPYPKRRFTIRYSRDVAVLWEAVLALYHRAYCSFAGFRVKCLDDYTTRERVKAPTALDQALALVSSGVYQLQVAYGSGGTPLSIGLPVRTLFKPVSGTVKVGISGDEIPSAGWSADTTNGQVTFAADKTSAVSGISKAAQAVLTVGAGHPFIVGDSVHVSGVSGMTQINGQRAPVLAKDATTITLDINSTSFSTYTAGGVTHTRPQTGESVTGGCEFDIPCRFKTRIDVVHVAPQYRETGEIELEEMIHL